MIDNPSFTNKIVNSNHVIFNDVNVYDNYSHKKWTLKKIHSKFL